MLQAGKQGASPLTVVEVNAWTWLAGLGSDVTLANIPDAACDGLALPGCDAIWLMGVWSRSPAGRRVAREHPGLQDEYRTALPDYREKDVVGSPYSVHQYVVDARLGGSSGLAAARRTFARAGLKLIVDFVPNHVALDHPWTLSAKECFIVDDDKVLQGKDPYFPPWTDTAQLNAFSPAWRRRAVDTLLEIAGQADGVRCDMAMLAVNSVFSRTWGGLAGPRPETEFWTEVIGEVRSQYPDFVFIAEAYWDMEAELHQLGFDLCYDKRLYDRMMRCDVPAIRAHLAADPAYQARLLRFLENHDEPRAASRLEPAANRAALVALTTLPGARLFLHGQSLGRRVKLPVQLGREPIEEADEALDAFCRRALEVADTALFKHGEWALCDTVGWPDNSSHLNLLAWSWSHADELGIVVVNYSGQRSQGRVALPSPLPGEKDLLLRDPLNGLSYVRDADELNLDGLYVDLAPWEFHLMVRG